MRASFRLLIEGQGLCSKAGALSKIHMIKGQITSDRRSKRARSDGALRILFILRGSPREC